VRERSCKRWNLASCQKAGLVRGAEWAETDALVPSGWGIRSWGLSCPLIWLDPFWGGSPPKIESAPASGYAFVSTSLKERARLPQVPGVVQFVPFKG
jgi:hypothetical protein